VKNSTAISLAAGDLKHGGWLVSVEGDVGVGEVVYEIDAVLFADSDETLEKG